LNAHQLQISLFSNLNDSVGAREGQDLPEKPLLIFVKAALMDQS